MQLNGKLVRDTFRILHGKAVLSGRDADELSALLGSREELVAWLFVHGKIGVMHPEIHAHLKKIADAAIVIPSTPRKDKNYPMNRKTTAIAVEAALKAVFEAAALSNSDVDSLNAILNKLETNNE